MNDQYLSELIASATGALDPDEQGLVRRLPTNLGNAIALVAAHERLPEPARCLTQALGLLRTANPMSRVEPVYRLAFLLELAGYLRAQPLGRTRDLMAAIGAMGAARTVAEARDQRTAAELGIALGLGELASQLIHAA